MPEHIDNPPADSSSIRYDLVDVESRGPVEPGTRFDLVLAPTLQPDQVASIVAGDCTQGFALFPHSFQLKEFSFGGNTSCESFAQRIAAQVSSKLSFEFARPEQPLKLVAFE